MLLRERRMSRAKRKSDAATKPCSASVAFSTPAGRVRVRVRVRGRGRVKGRIRVRVRFRGRGRVRVRLLNP